MSKHVHLTKEESEKAIASKNRVKMQEFNQMASSCVFCKRIWIRALAEQKPEVDFGDFVKEFIQELSWSKTRR